VLDSVEVLAPAGTDPGQLARRLAALPGVRTATAPPRPGLASRDRAGQRPARRRAVHAAGLLILALARMAELVRAYADLPLGAVDASVIAIAERLKLTDVATLDRRHFTVVRPKHAKALNLLP
jgi:hypothetical protein